MLISQKYKSFMRIYKGKYFVSQMQITNLKI